MSDRATYTAVGTDVWMTDTEGFQSVIQTCRTPELAKRAAKRWQDKEDAAAQTRGYMNVIRGKDHA